MLPALLRRPPPSVVQARPRAVPSVFSLPSSGLSLQTSFTLHPSSFFGYASSSGRSVGTSSNAEVYARLRPKLRSITIAWKPMRTAQVSRVPVIVMSWHLNVGARVRRGGCGCFPWSRCSSSACLNASMPRGFSHGTAKLCNTRKAESL